MNTLKKLQSYAGNRKALFPVSMLLSALSALAGLPYIIIWLVRELFEAGGAASGLEQRIVPLAWWAVGAAAGNIVIYFAALSIRSKAVDRPLSTVFDTVRLIRQ